MRKERGPDTVVNRMAIPSWVVLGLLNASQDQSISGFEIQRRAEELFREANSPMRKIDPSTFARIIKRMLADGLIIEKDSRETDVPVPHGKTIRDIRPHYSITDFGIEMMDRKIALEHRLLRI